LSPGTSLTWAPGATGPFRGSVVPGGPAVAPGGRGSTGPGGFLSVAGMIVTVLVSWALNMSVRGAAGRRTLVEPELRAWPPRIRREHRHIDISLGQVSEHSRPRVMVVPDAFAGDEDGVEHELGRLERAEEDQRARLEVAQERTTCSSRSATADRGCRGNDRRRRTGRCSAADHSPHPASRCAA
jgi:hypothetical protein